MQRSEASDEQTRMFLKLFLVSEVELRLAPLPASTQTLRRDFATVAAHEAIREAISVLLGTFQGEGVTR